MYECLYGPPSEAGLTSKDKVSVTVLGLNGENLLQYEVPFGHMVGALKADLARTLGYPARAMKLLSGSEELNDGLSFQPLPPRATLNAIFELTCPTDDAFCDAVRNGHHGYARAILACVHGQARRDMLLLTHKGPLRALDLAAERGHAEVASVLVAAAAEDGVLEELLNTASTLSDTRALQIAVMHGHESVVRLLTSAAAGKGLRRDHLLERGLLGSTLLHHAAHRGLAEVAQVLLEEAAEEGVREELLAQRNYNYVTSLELAVRQGHGAVVEVLAAAEATDLPGTKALHSAAVTGHEAVVHLLISAAAKSGLRRELLLKRDAQGGTPLHSAARCGKARIARLIVEAAAEEGIREELLEQRGDGDITALELAARGDRGEVVEVLVAAAADSGGYFHALSGE